LGGYTARGSYCVGNYLGGWQKRRKVMTTIITRPMAKNGFVKKRTETPFSITLTFLKGAVAKKLF
jgi:hypothetical protein